MTLTEQISQDLTNAMKAGDRLLMGTLRLLRAALLELQKSGTEVTPETELKAIQKQARSRKDAAEEYVKAGRQDLADKEEAELKIIQTYLPQQMDDAAIRALVEGIATETGAAGPGDFKLVMPKAMAALRGRADGAKVQSIVKEVLEGKGA
ncbi:MAG: GatB/YqeY domain-containing protein [Bacteroidota bacterium]